MKRLRNKIAIALIMTHCIEASKTQPSANIIQPNGIPVKMTTASRPVSAVQSNRSSTNFTLQYMDDLFNAQNSSYASAASAPEYINFTPPVTASITKVTPQAQSQTPKTASSLHISTAQTPSTSITARPVSLNISAPQATNASIAARPLSLNSSLKPQTLSSKPAIFDADDLPESLSSQASLPNNANLQTTQAIGTRAASTRISLPINTGATSSKIPVRAQSLNLSGPSASNGLTEIINTNSPLIASRPASTNSLSLKNNTTAKSSQIEPIDEPTATPDSQTVSTRPTSISQSGASWYASIVPKALYDVTKTNGGWFNFAEEPQDEPSPLSMQEAATNNANLNLSGNTNITPNELARLTTQKAIQENITSPLNKIMNPPVKPPKPNQKPTLIDQDIDDTIEPIENETIQDSPTNQPGQPASLVPNSTKSVGTGNKPAPVRQNSLGTASTKSSSSMDFDEINPDDSAPSPNTPKNPTKKVFMASTIKTWITEQFYETAQTITPTPSGVKAFARSIASTLNSGINFVKQGSTNKILEQQINDAADDFATQATSNDPEVGFLEKGINQQTFKARFGAWISKLTDKIYSLMGAEKPSNITMIPLQAQTASGPGITLTFNERTQSVVSASVLYKNKKYNINQDQIKSEDGIYTVDVDLLNSPTSAANQPTFLQSINNNLYDGVVKNSIFAPIKNSAFGQAIVSIPGGEDTINMVQDQLLVTTTPSEGKLKVTYNTKNNTMTTETIKAALPKKVTDTQGSITSVPNSASVKTTQNYTYNKNTGQIQPQSSVIELLGDQAQLELFNPIIKIDALKDVQGHLKNLKNASVSYKNKTYTNPTIEVNSNGVTTISYENESAPQPGIIRRGVNTAFNAVADPIIAISKPIITTGINAGSSALNSAGTMAGNIFINNTSTGKYFDALHVAVEKQYPGAINEFKNAASTWWSQPTEDSIRKISMDYDPGNATITTRVQVNMSNGTIKTNIHTYPVN